MFQRSSLLSRASLVAALFAATGPLLHADDPNAQASPDGRIIKVKSGDKTASFLVHDNPDPFRDVSTPNTTGKYDPENIFSHTSSMADKSFLSNSTTANGGNTEFSGHQAFATQPYVDDKFKSNHTDAYSAQTFPTHPATESNTASGFTKSFPTARDTADQKAANLGSGPDKQDQNHTASLGGPDKPDLPQDEDPMGTKQYLGPGAQHVPKGINIKENVSLLQVNGLPDRPLSIDEVRELINHGVAPDTSIAPLPPSKPLNDPNYQPRPLRDNPNPNANSSGHPADDDKEDTVPPPGTMAEPENAEPLPQR